MSFTGTVENGAIKLPKGVHLADGTKVQVQAHPRPDNSKPARQFITRTHDFGFKPGIDLTKLGQLAEEL